YDSDEHKAWVADLAAALRRDGVWARLDVWDRDGAQSIPDFMNAEVRQADDVLVVCTPVLQAKVHATEELKGQTGVGWEVGLINTMAFALGRRKMVPVIASGTVATAIPTSLLGFEHFDLASKEQYAANYSRLHERLLRGPAPEPGPKV